MRDLEAVDEILQETALAATATSNVPADECGIRRWLYRVAVRQSVLYRRKQGRNKKKNQGYAFHADHLKTNPDNPLQILLATEQAELVNLALSNLANRDCEVLLLKYREGWSCQQMAERLGVSQSAVKSRLLRARRNLRTELSKSEHWNEP